MDAIGIDQSELARRVGCSSAAINQIVNDKTQNSRFLPRIASRLGVSTQYLLGLTDVPIGDDSENANTDDGRALATQGHDDVEIDSIDLAYGMGGAFLDSEAEVEKVRFSRAWLRQFTDTAPVHLFSTQGIGDSMMPTILDRDIVIIDRSQNSMVDQMGEKIWAIVFGGVGMIKRLRPLPDGTIKIMSDNQLVRDELATDGDLFIVGRVVASVRRH